MITVNERAVDINYCMYAIVVDMVIRSHEVKHQGYQVEHNGRCVTIFSAPNYWYVVYSWNRFRVYNVIIRLDSFHFNCTHANL